ncbi:hypothetical protein ACFX4N_24010 [Priestia sp. YIM B13551]|uniref:hypothetical protein n=1 Tax=Priestia sp. YIM B13551 TaxID=3366306 RepID=UPI00366C8878
MLDQIKSNYLKSWKEAREAESRADVEIAMLEEQLQQWRDRKRDAVGLHAPQWIFELVEPIAKAIAEQLNVEYLLNSPNGSRKRLTIYFYTKQGTLPSSQQFKTLVIVPGNVEKAELFYETGEITKGPKYVGGSPSAKDGFNNEIAPLPNTLKEIIDIVLKDGVFDSAK